MDEDKISVIWVEDTSSNANQEVKWKELKSELFTTNDDSTISLGCDPDVEYAPVYVEETCGELCPHYGNEDACKGNENDYHISSIQLNVKNS